MICKIATAGFAAAFVWALAFASLVVAPARADMILLSPPIGDATVPGLYPQPPSAPSAGTATGAGPAAASINTLLGTLTTASLTTAVNATYVLTVTDTFVAAGDVVVASVGNLTNSGGIPVIASVVPSNGQVIITLANAAQTGGTAFNGTLNISFYVLKQAAPQ